MYLKKIKIMRQLLKEMDESESNINKFNEVPYNFLMTCLKKFKKN